MQALTRWSAPKLIGLFLWALGLTLLAAGCAPGSPSLERFEGSEWIEVGPVVVESMSGQRDGADVRATGVFSHGEDRMTLSLEFVLGPPARFVRGRHSSRIAGQFIESPVSSESVTFLGGQSDAPSIGGVFLFENPRDGSRYRLRFPPTLMNSPR